MGCDGRPWSPSLRFFKRLSSRLFFLISTRLSSLLLRASSASTPVLYDFLRTSARVLLGRRDIVGVEVRILRSQRYCSAGVRRNATRRQTQRENEKKREMDYKKAGWVGLGWVGGGVVCVYLYLVMCLYYFFVWGAV